MKSPPPSWRNVPPDELAACRQIAFHWAEAPPSHPSTLGHTHTHRWSAATQGIPAGEMGITPATAAAMMFNHRNQPLKESFYIVF